MRQSRHIRVGAWLLWVDAKGEHTGNALAAAENGLYVVQEGRVAFAPYSQIRTTGWEVCHP